MNKINIMFTKKSLFIIPFLTIILIFFTGCATKNKVNEDIQENHSQTETKDSNAPANTFGNNLEESNLDDLTIGQKIIVMATEDSGGNASANQILIGNTETDFEKFNQMTRSRVQTVENNTKSETATPPPTNTPDKQNFKQSQNMTEEDRAKLQEKMQANNVNKGTKTFSTKQAITRFIGEIVKKDEISLTMKLDAGGSKLIFFSADTKVNIIKIETENQSN